MANGLNNGSRQMNGDTSPHGRSPDRIQDEIRATRSQMDSTLDAIQQKLSPHNLTDELIHYVRNGGANEFAQNLNEAVKRNPVPVTLMGIGMAWLMMSGKEGRYAPDRAPASSGQFGQKLSNVANRLSSAASAGRERLSSGRESMGQAGSSMRERASHAGSSVRERASHAGSSVRERASHAGSSMRDQAASLSAGARERAARISDSARYGAYRARGGFETALREQPLMLGAIGIAIGAALGSLLPPTRQEDEWMGDTRDRLAGQAKQQANLQLRKGKRIAKAAGEAATHAAEEEAGRQRSGSGNAEEASSTEQQPSSARPAPGL